MTLAKLLTLLTEENHDFPRKGRLNSHKKA